MQSFSGGTPQHQTIGLRWPDVNIYALSGWLLVAAACGKIVFPTTADHTSSLIYSSHIFGELLLGAYFIQTRGGAWVWRLAVCCFATLSTISAYKLFRGAATCGCFGRIAVPPAATLLINLAIIASVLRIAPAQVVRQHVVSWMPITLVICFAAAASFAVARQTERSRLATLNPPAPTTSQAPRNAVEASITLGQSDEATAHVGKSSGEKEYTLRLTVENPFEQVVAVKVDEIECDCISATAIPREIAAGKSGELLFKFITPKGTTGVYSKLIRLRTNAPAGTTIQLRVTAVLD